MKEGEILLKWKRWTVVLAATMMLAACGDEGAKDGEVEVTLLPNYFEGMSEADIEASAEDQNIEVQEIHKDNSVTYMMTEQRQEELLADVEASIEESMKLLVETGDFPSIKDVEAKDDYLTFDVTVDRAAFESGTDMIGTMNLYVGSSYLYGYKNEPNPSITMNFIDSETQEVYETIVLPDDMEVEDAEVQ